MRKPFRRRCLPITYVRGRKEAGVIGHDGHFRAIITRLIEKTLLELYGYVRILFESGIEVPVMALQLWSRAMDPRDNLPPFLLKMNGLMSIKHDSGED